MDDDNVHVFARSNQNMILLQKIVHKQKFKSLQPEHAEKNDFSCNKKSRYPGSSLIINLQIPPSHPNELDLEEFGFILSSLQKYKRYKCYEQIFVRVYIKDYKSTQIFAPTNNFREELQGIRDFFPFYASKKVYKAFKKETIGNNEVVGQCSNNNDDDDDDDDDNKNDKYDNHGDDENEDKDQEENNDFDFQINTPVCFYFMETQLVLSDLKSELSNMSPNTNQVTILNIDDLSGLLLTNLSELDACKILEELEKSDQITKYYLLPRLCSFGSYSVGLSSTSTSPIPEDVGDPYYSTSSPLQVKKKWGVKNWLSYLMNLAWASFFLTMHCYLFFFDWFRAVIIKMTLVPITRRIALVFARGEGGAIFKYQRSCVIASRLFDRELMRAAHVEVYSGCQFGVLNDGSFYTYNELKQDTTRFWCFFRAVWEWLCNSPSSFFTFTFLLGAFSLMIFFPFKGFVDYMNTISSADSISGFFTWGFILRGLFNYPLATLFLTLIFNKYFVVLRGDMYEAKLKNNFATIFKRSLTMETFLKRKHITFVSNGGDSNSNSNSNSNRKNNSNCGSDNNQPQQRYNNHKIKGDHVNSNAKGAWRFNMLVIILVSACFGFMFVCVPMIFIIAKICQGIVNLVNGLTNIKRYVDTKTKRF